MKERPVIGITMGDPAGIGPEIILSWLARRESPFSCTPLIIGSESVLAATAEKLGLPDPCTKISGTGPLFPSDGRALILDVANIHPGEYATGRISDKTGRASLEYVFKAIELALAGKIDAMVTAPIHKEAIHMAGYSYAGHTELLAEKTNTQNFAMMLVGGPLRVVLVTTHLPLREVPGKLSTDQVLQKILLADQAARALGFPSPRIAVAGLNPHGGEGGIFGDEEERIIAPAVMQAEKQGIDASGPLPPDTLFHKAYRGEFHAVVSMYHDQGLIPLKMIAFDQGVNITLGLPIIRTSVDHGTALDIAGKGIAHSESLAEAVGIALKLVRHRRQSRC